MNKNTNSEKETLIGIDYGSANIGVALGKNGFVQPLEIVPAQNLDTALHKIIKIALQAKASKFIIGLPLDAQGKETNQAQKIRKFGKNLKIKSKKSVEYIDEHLSSKEALKKAISQGISKKRRSSHDHIAAGIILKRYYEEKGNQNSQERFLSTSHIEI